MAELNLWFFGKAHIKVTVASGEFDMRPFYGDLKSSLLPYLTRIHVDNCGSSPTGWHVLGGLS